MCRVVGETGNRQRRLDAISDVTCPRSPLGNPGLHLAGCWEGRPCKLRGRAGVLSVRTGMSWAGGEGAARGRCPGVTEASSAPRPESPRAALGLCGAWEAQNLVTPDVFGAVLPKCAQSMSPLVKRRAHVWPKKCVGLPPPLPATALQWRPGLTHCPRAALTKDQTQKCTLQLWRPESESWSHRATLPLKAEGGGPFASSSICWPHSSVSASVLTWPPPLWVRAPLLIIGTPVMGLKAPLIQ